MSERDEDYEVGYGKPPRHTRFKKGQSGNPKGRPKGAKGLNASLKRELESQITIREGNREVRVSKAEAMAKRLATSALQGNMKALLALLKIDPMLFDAVNAELEKTEHASRADAVDYDILRDFFSDPHSAGDGCDGAEADDDGA
ncbi:DUF5681 domain-containing protein [Antarcticimicrobium luteum]|uniref:DUF5681 domain-containing protein n=1 Tax=Antarcticimicrobium luteum TaxID=2547397 RepID=UPI0014079B7F|nr:DUF5681 domain-containing protein [Antarcticimicrobium luteum]